MCMKKFDAEKVFFDKMTEFEVRHCLKTALYKYWLIVHNLFNSSSQSFNWIFSVFCIHTRDLVNMCMKKFDVERNVFCQTCWVSNFAIFLRQYLVNNGW